MSFSKEWEEVYRAGKHKSIWPWSDLVSLSCRYLRGNLKRKKVLELGCGAGANIPFFLSLGMDYYGVEGSEYQACEVSKRFKDENVRILAGDFTKSIPFEMEFDLVVDRGSITCNSSVDIKNTLDVVWERLSENGFFIGIDWFSDSHDTFKGGNDQDKEKIDERTYKFYKGYFSGLGAVHFFSEEEIYSLFEKYVIIELSEKKVCQCIPQKSMCSSWNVVAKKSKMWEDRLNGQK